MGYLLCKSCGGRYDLQPGELPGDFESCSCGGELEFYDDHGHKRAYMSVNKYKDNSKKKSPLMKVLIIAGVGYIIFIYVGSFVMAYYDAVNHVQQPGGLYTFFTGPNLIFNVAGLIVGIIVALICYFYIKNSSKNETKEIEETDEQLES